ncbi:MAG TPA: arginine deiminase family protein, partial [Acidimicrobiales bacterium]|nr:arginine deiminase family protein [Acidimicrobiales bacterium]
MVVYRDTAVMACPAEASRQGELKSARSVVEALGLEIEEITSPGTLDGGDVLKVGETIYVGQSDRTNAEGVRELAAILGPRGATVVPVPVTRVLHLKSAVTALPDGTVIGYPPLVDDSSLFDRFLAVPEERGAHVVVVDERRIIMASGCPETEDLFLAMGYEPIAVDIGEFEKLEGCVTCLSVRLRDL